MRSRLCPETKQYPAAHPDRLFLDMTGLAQLLPGTPCCLETETEAVKWYLPHVTHSSKMTFTFDCRHDDYDSQVNVSLPCYVLLRRLLLPGLFNRGSFLAFSPSSSSPVLQVCCEWKSCFGLVINQVGSGWKKVVAVEAEPSLWPPGESFSSASKLRPPFQNRATTHQLISPQGEALASIGLLARCCNMSSWLVGLL